MTVRPLELWGGIECSVVRIGDATRDQVRETGHHARPDDLDRIAKLGIQTLRYPVLWERCGESESGWAWHDSRLHALLRLGITPIAGLVHHGMGPLPGGLLDPGFAPGLAAHAGQVARRYPFLRLWTPVNEPLTTARLACLYGHWHPHLKDEGAFLRATAAQCRAALLAMRAVRAHVPDARFMHTEDIGRTFSTARLAGQAAYENDRRWLSLDLLCGHVEGAHPWRGRLEAHGVDPAHLDELATGEAAPDLIGVNHYLTSDRFLDHRLGLYPAHLHGGNGRVAYADTEAVRMNMPEGSAGWLPRLREVWARYRRPLVVSEAHLGCDDPREQVRWLMEAWDAAQSLRVKGADIRAVTAWALLGLHDWSSMLLERRGHYEPGALDTSRDPPRCTLLADTVMALACEGRFTHPALLSPGWWHRDDRVLAAPHLSTVLPDAHRTRRQPLLRHPATEERAGT